MKLKSIKLRIKTWIFNTFLKRYLVSVDKRFIELFIVHATKKPRVVVETAANREYKRIMKVLSSQRFKDYFYKVVKYNRLSAESLIRPYTNKVKDKLFSFIARTYIFLFNKDLYNSIKQFNQIKTGILSLDKKIDSYMEKTTLDERADRALQLGIIADETRSAQKRLRKIQSSRVSKILAQNQE